MYSSKIVMKLSTRGQNADCPNCVPCSAFPVLQYIKIESIKQRLSFDTMGDDYLGDEVWRLVKAGRFDNIVKFTLQHRKKLARIYYRKLYHEVEHLDLSVPMMAYALMILKSRGEFEGEPHDLFRDYFQLDDVEANEAMRELHLGRVELGRSGIVYLPETLNLLRCCPEDRAN